MDVKKVLDLSTPRTEIDSVVEAVRGNWSFDLYSRKPIAALNDEGVKVTSLDLISLLDALAAGSFYLKIPEYRAMGKRTVKSNEVVTSRANRHGSVMAVVSSKKDFKFSVRIDDQNVISTVGEKQTVGAPRTFNLTTPSGHWYRGWKELEFIPSAKMKQFIADHDIAQADRIVVEHMISPNRWPSFYGRNYRQLKLLVERLTLEAKFAREEKTRLIAFAPQKEAGFEAPESEQIGETRDEEVTTLEAKIEAEFTGQFTPYETSAEGWKAADERSKLSYGLIPKLNVHARATEFAFFHAVQKGYAVPEWARVDVVQNYKETAKSRTLWTRLQFPDGMALLYRTVTKTQQVAVTAPEDLEA